MRGRSRGNQRRRGAVPERVADREVRTWSGMDAGSIADERGSRAVCGEVALDQIRDHRDTIGIGFGGHSDGWAGGIETSV